ncbi:MAG: AAC(3) family N-acetyltransferase [Anaerolineales bacterium]|nr:AAC(3) family N-acetyltransferase [Anaerolineales bacterium]
MSNHDAQLNQEATEPKPIGYRQLVRAFRELPIPPGRPVLVHSSLSAFGEVLGGAETVAGALAEVFNSIVVPTFTYKTLVIPESGPPDNAITYGSQADMNKMAEFFYPDMPADKLMGVVAETVRRHPEAHRSGHPVMSFAGLNARQYLEKQLLTEPLAPIAAMYDRGGWVLLLGVDHTANTSIHLGERLAGRKMYTRWALMSDLIVTCTNTPYCSDGFNAIAPLIDPFVDKARIGKAEVQAMPLHELIETTRQLIQADQTALLCSRTDCPSCNTVRRLVIRLKNGIVPPTVNSHG